MKSVDTPNARARPRDVSVIVPAHADGDSFARCVAALARLDPAPREVLIAADGRSDEALAERVEGAGFRFLESTGQVTGPAATRNRGAEAATGSLLFFVDSDVVVPNDAVAILCAVFSDYPGSAAVFGSYDRRPADPALVSQFVNLMHHRVHQMSRVEAETFWAGCGAVDSSWFRRVGGFDESYRRPAIEDIELGYRLREAGGRIVVAKELQVCHLKRWTLAQMMRTHVFDRALPWTRLLVERGALDDNLNIDLRSRLAAVTVLLLLSTLVGAAFEPRLLVLAALSIAVLLILERRLYGFFLAERGLLFAARAIPLHWLYLFYSATAFVVGSVLARSGRR